MKIEPGTFGYRRKKWFGRLALVSALGGIIIMLLMTRSLIEDSNVRALLTVSSILVVLPFGNIAAPLFASVQYKSASREFYHKVHPYENKTRILYDLILTTPSQIIPLDAIIVHPVCIVGYCPSAKLDIAKAEKGINELLYAAKIEKKIKILKDEHAFFHRLEVLKPMDAYEDDGVVEYTCQTLKNLSM